MENGHKMGIEKKQWIKNIWKKNCTGLEMMAKNMKRIKDITNVSRLCETRTVMWPELGCIMVNGKVMTN